MQVTLLTDDQIWGNQALDIIKNYGSKGGASDLAVALGAFISTEETTIEGVNSAAYWSSSKDDSFVLIVDGQMPWQKPYQRISAVRPAIPSSETFKIRPSAARKIRLPNHNVINICEYGEFPQTVADDQTASVLESEYKSKNLQTTGKSYTFDSITLYDYDTYFKPAKHQEYMYQGKKYIRVEGRHNDKDSVMSNGELVDYGKAYWFEVQPIEWLQDPSGLWLAKQGLVSGIQFDRTNAYGGDFSKTDMKNYLNNYFAQEILPSHNNTIHLDRQEDKELTARQRKFSIEVEKAPMPVKDQIDFYIKSGMSFMLHGPSGIGKTARVEAIDPDLTAVPLWNGVLPEDVVGKVRYPNGETEQPGGVWVAPDWYVELCKKCEQEPNKKHVLFIDEVTNARPTTQSLIFHIALKKSISPSKGKLPDNAVVVLAGNSKEESGAAYNMPEPLFRRMCGHIYLEPNVPEWLEWASEKSNKHPDEPDRLNIHPLVSSFVATYGQKVFYSPYDEEQPEKWAIDPRGWEQVSDIIYDNKGIIRRELLESKLGPELSASLLAYAQHPPLSLEEVIEGAYNPKDIPQKNDAKLALTMNLRHVDDKHVDKVRDFIGSQLGRENQAIFDSLWIGNNTDHAVQIAQMQRFKSNGGR